MLMADIFPVSLAIIHSSWVVKGVFVEKTVNVISVPRDPAKMYFPIPLC